MQQHRELELMNSFREQFGRDWLQYRNHLETSGISALASSKTPALSTLPPDTLSPEPVPSPPLPEESPQNMAEEVRVGPEPQAEEEFEEQGKEEEEEEEQKEVEGELLVAAGWSVWEGGVADPLWMEGPLMGGQRLGTFLFSQHLS